MKFIHTGDPALGTQAMADRISDKLNEDKKVLWLICGGSNVPIAVEAMRLIRAKVLLKNLDNLTVAETDERYGPVGHPDSNWAQLIDAGFAMNGIATLNILTGKSLEATAYDYGHRLKPVIESVLAAKGEIVGQFGVGTNAHIAGIYPHSSAVDDVRLVSGYDSGDFVRVTLDPVGLKKVTVAYMFAFGPTKVKPLIDLRDKDLSVTEAPVQILKQLPEVYIYSDKI